MGGMYNRASFLDKNQFVCWEDNSRQIMFGEDEKVRKKEKKSER